MAKLADPIDSLPPEAKRVYEKITVKRGNVRGPFASLMHNPELAERVGDLGLGGLMELVVLAGHYRLIAGVLFAFDTPLPDGTPPPF